MTRLFAPPAERKVLSLDVDGESRVPHARWTWRAPGEVLELPAGARWLDDAFAPDAADVVFGLHHTDSNQHVNSLVYPRLFQDAALRRFAQHRRDARLLARRIEIAYRKPCFAGDRVEIVMRAFAAGDELGAVGALVSASAPLERPHCTMQVRFSV